MNDAAKDFVSITLAFGDDCVDVSSGIVADSFSLREDFCNAEFKSTLNVASWQLIFSDDLFFKLRDYNEKIFVLIKNQYGDILFDGVMEPVLVGEWGRPDLSAPITCEAVDFTEQLDELIMASLSFPLNVGDDPFYIFNKADLQHSILYKLLKEADLHVRISADAPNILNQIEQVSVIEGTESFRDVIDQLLSDFSHVLTAQGDLISWGPITAYTLDEGIDIIDSADIIAGPQTGFRVSRRYNFNDGVSVEYPKTKIMEDALLWRGSLPVGDPSNPTPGEPIAGGDYWPEDSDIVDTWQDYDATYLDTAYLSGKSRIRNEETILLASSGHYLRDLKDEHIHIDGDITYESLRAQVRYKNSGVLAERLYWSEIYGTALVQSARSTMTYPPSSANPAIYDARFIFTPLDAQSAVESRFILQRAGQWDLAFQSLRTFSPGQFVRITQPQSRWDGYALIVSRQRSFNGSGLWSYSLVSTTPVADLSAITVRAISTQGSQSPFSDSQNLVVKNALVKPGTLDEREDFEFRATTGKVGGDGEWDIAPEFYIKTGEDYLLAIDNNFLDVEDGGIKKRALIAGNGDFAVTNKRTYARNMNADGFNAVRCNIHGNVDAQILINPAIIAQPSSRAVTAQQTVKNQEKRLAYDLCVWAKNNGISFNNLHRCEVSEEPNIGWVMFAADTALGAWGSSEINCAVYFYDDNGKSRYNCWSKSTQEAYQVQNTWIFGWPWFGTHTEYRWAVYGTLSGDKQCLYGDPVSRGQGFIVAPVQSIDPSSVTIEIPGYGTDLRHNPNVSGGSGFKTTWGHPIIFRCYFGSDYDLYMKKLPGSDTATLAALPVGALYRGTGGAIYVK